MAEPKRDRAKLIGFFALVSIILVASILSPLSFVYLSGSALILAVCYPFIRNLRRGWDAGDAIYPFVMYFFAAMGFRGFAVLTYQDSPYLRSLQDPASPHFQQLMGWVFLCSALALVSLYAGYASPYSNRLSDVLLRVIPRPAEWRIDRVVAIGLTWMGVGLLGAILYARSFGGFARATSDLVYVATEGSLGRFWQIALMEFGVVGFHLLLVQRMASVGRRVSPLVLALCLPVLAAFFLLTSAKFLILRILIPPLLVWHVLRRRIRFVHLVALLAIFGALFPVFYAYREYGLSPQDGIGAVLGEGSESPLIAMPLVLFTRAYDADSFALILDHSAEGLRLKFGSTLADLAYFFVPRAVWPGKPPSYSLQFAEQYAPDVFPEGMTYVSPSLIGELFENFHVVGIVLGCFGLGVLIKSAYLAARSGGPSTSLLYGYFFLTAVHIVEGSIAAQIEFLLMSAVPAWAALAILGRWDSGELAALVSGASRRTLGQQKA